MTHQNKLSSPMQIAHEPIVKQHLSLPLALAILAVGLMVGVFATQLSTAENNNEVNWQRAIEAEAARYTSLGMFYAAGNEAQAERAIEVEAARYTNMAKFYLDEAQAQRAIEAEAARYSGLATFYTGENEISRQRGLEAEAARYNGIANFYLTENGVNVQRAIEAEAARYSGMAEFYLTENLAWPSRPTQFQPIEKSTEPLAEDALMLYHQGEWGRTPSTVLPIVENKTDVNRDIGLMEFFAAPNETSRERTELGALEALPNIDPADRKFFSPGYGAISGVSEESEALPAIDPADRKFFILGYGAQIVKFGETEALPAIDPADRKFFNPGYGVQP